MSGVCVRFVVPEEPALLELDVAAIPPVVVAEHSHQSCAAARQEGALQWRRGRTSGGNRRTTRRTRLPAPAARVSARRPFRAAVDRRTRNRWTASSERRRRAPPGSSLHDTPRRTPHDRCPGCAASRADARRMAGRQPRRATWESSRSQAAGAWRARRPGLRRADSREQHLRSFEVEPEADFLEARAAVIADLRRR